MRQNDGWLDEYRAEMDAAQCDIDTIQPLLDDLSSQRNVNLMSSNTILMT